jgi:hypothetical protein
MTIITYVPEAPSLEPEPIDIGTRSRAGRKSEKERLQTKAEAERLARELHRESKRATPLLADTRGSLIVAVALVTLLMVSSFAVSFAGIYQVSAYTGLPAYLQWLPALFIDAAILAYTISLIIFKSRGVSTWRTLAGLAGFATLSVGANVAHTLGFWNGNVGDYRAWVGVAITAAAPIAVLLASEEIGRLAFAQPGVGK